MNHQSKVWLMIVFLAFSLTVLLGSNCSINNDREVSHHEIQALPTDEKPGTSSEKSVDNLSVAEVTEANNKFALDFYGYLNEEQPGNIFFSPFSISVALAMTYEGARGQTAEEIKKVFHYPDDINVLRQGYADIICLINRKDKNYELSTANALWAHQDYYLLPDFIEAVEKYYGGKVTNLDFVHDSENSRLTINNWVEEQTRNKIKNLIPQGVINQLTRLVLTNAIYFKGNWKKQFPKSNTREDDFKITADKTIKVPMMSITGSRFNYTENQDLQLLELPYVDREMSMLILLPKGDLSKAEPYLEVEKFEELKNKLQEAEVDVYLPRFKFETKYLMGGEQGILGRMGMPTVFSRTSADLSGINGRQDLCLTEVIHQAFVEVNEEGTEAAAATGVIMGVKMVLEKLVFRADHPFVFIIQHMDTGNILFLGRVIEPGG